MEQPPVFRLPTDALLRVFGKLSPDDRHGLRFVCKQWALQLKVSGVLYEQLDVDTTARHSREFHAAIEGQFELWAGARAPFARRLRLTLGPDDRDLEHSTDLAYILFSRTSERLEQLEVTVSGWLWLPHCLAGLRSLRVLKLQADCANAALPTWLACLEALEELHIDMEVAGGYRVAERFLPLQLLSLSRLRLLSLQRCRGLTVPLAIGELLSLKTFSITDCASLAFAEGAFLRDAFSSASLTRLRLAGCNLASVPHQVVGMTNLRELDLSENNLVVLPATFSVGLKRLRRLLLRGNRLGRLPRLLARLPALEHLDLSHNDPLQVYESEWEEEEAAGDNPPRRNRLGCRQGGRQGVHTISSIVGSLPRLQHLDLRQAPWKAWHPRSRAELERLRELAGGGAPGVPCALRTLLL